MTEDIWNNVDNQHLDARSFNEVREHVSSLAGYWPGFASVLGLPPSAIREIEASHLRPAQCLEDAIGRWLHEDYKVERFGSPSWKVLVRAVEDRNGGRNPALAKKIAQEHPSLNLNHQPANVQVGYSSDREAVPNGSKTELSYVVQESGIHTRSQVECPHVYALSSTSSRSAYQAVRQPYSLSAEEKSHSSPLGEGSYQKIDECLAQRFPSLTEGNVQPMIESFQTTPASPSNVENSPSFANSRSKSGIQKSFLNGEQTITYQCYGACDDGWSSGGNVVLSSQSIKPILQKRIEHFNHYEMGCHPHGVAVIISNKNFTHIDHIDTSTDELNLIQTFRNIGYNVELYCNLDANEITAVFENVGKRDHSAYDSFVGCVMTCSDGQGNIYSCDCKKLGLDSLVSNSLGGAMCRTLFGKPKMIFISAHCVPMDDSKRRVDEDGDTIIPLGLPSQADFFYGSSSVLASDYYHNDGSSPYVTTLCEALCKHGLYADLTSIHEIVQRGVAESCQQRGLKHVTENSNRLTKKVYFTN